MTKSEIKLIKEQYPILKEWNDNLAIEIYKNMIESKQNLKEFLHTVAPPMLFKQLNNLINQPGFDFIEIIDNITPLTGDFHNKDVISSFEIVFKEVDPENLKKFVDFMDKYGWYPSYIYDYGKYDANIHKVLGKNNITIIFEAKYDTEIAINNSDLYHVTPDVYWDKIKRIGLTPKSQGKLANHPGRIYLVKSNSYPELEGTHLDIADLADVIGEAAYNKEKINQMYVLKIDSSKLNKDIKFYYDPNYKMGIGIYTYSNIPPTVIKLIDQIDFYE